MGDVPRGGDASRSTRRFRGPSVPLPVWFVACFVIGAIAAPGAEWRVPMGGNAYLMASKPGSNDGLHRGGTDVRWHDPETTWTVWFHVDRPAAVEIGRAHV